MKAPRIDFITMGCSKNLVDTERLMRRLEAKGYEPHHNSHDVQGPLVVVNTCGFIADAKQESIDMILSLSEAKKEGRIERLIVMGCLSERHGKELQPEIPEVDAWYGKFDWEKIVNDLPLMKSSYTVPEIYDRNLTTPPYSTYLKISEGCNRMCAYCAIPLITGRHRSRPMDEILAETVDLASKGVKEFNVIAQDLSAYGSDLGGTLVLPELIERMADVKGVEWIRLHYAYPTDFPWEITRVMRERDNVCSYLDIALQHISTRVLTNMRRHIDSSQTYDLIARLRDEVPDLKLRTTLMTGFPGEGEKEFAELLEFMQKVKFERLGAFAYCEEEDTWAARNLEDTIPEEVKQQRLEQIMELQEGISHELHREMIGKQVKVLIEENGDDELTGRTQWDSPEVDPVVLMEGNVGTADIAPGTFVKAKITDAEPYELIGKIIHK